MNMIFNEAEPNQRTRSIADDEDYITLLKVNGDSIYYVRNYIAAVEFIVLSEKFIEELPNELRPCTNILVQSNFYVIREFKNQIKRHLLQSDQLRHFNYLFNCSVSDFFEEL